MSVRLALARFDATLRGADSDGRQGSPSKSASLPQHARHLARQVAPSLSESPAVREPSRGICFVKVADCAAFVVIDITQPIKTVNLKSHNPRFPRRPAVIVVCLSVPSYMSRSRACCISLFREHRIPLYSTFSSSSTLPLASTE